MRFDLPIAYSPIEMGMRSCPIPSGAEPPDPRGWPSEIEVTQIGEKKVAWLMFWKEEGSRFWDVGLVLILGYAASELTFSREGLSVEVEPIPDDKRRAVYEALERMYPTEISYREVEWLEDE